MITFIAAQQGRIVDFDNEKPQRLSRTNRSGRKILFGCAVTDAPDNGVTPPEDPFDRILGFTVQITEDDLMDTANWVPQAPFYRPGDIVCVTRYDRIKAIAPCDVVPGEQVFVAAHTGLPACDGLLAAGCTWESIAPAGELAVIQVNTRAV
jgi:hypothetical protein